MKLDDASPSLRQIRTDMTSHKTRENRCTIYGIYKYKYVTRFDPTQIQYLLRLNFSKG
jgi:hypothetical protein